MKFEPIPKMAGWVSYRLKGKLFARRDYGGGYFTQVRFEDGVAYVSGYLLRAHAVPMDIITWLEEQGLYT